MKREVVIDRVEFASRGFGGMFSGMGEAWKYQGHFHFFYDVSIFFVKLRFEGRKLCLIWLQSLTKGKVLKLVLVETRFCCAAVFGHRWYYPSKSNLIQVKASVKGLVRATSNHSLPGCNRWAFDAKLMQLIACLLLSVISLRSIWIAWTLSTR